MDFGGVEFSLSEAFVSKYKRAPASFGPLGLFTYKRTYARPLENGKSEDWWQTVRRVVEGCYLIQKRHCQLLHIPWNERQAKKSAEIMYGLIFDFKFLPPGRGLWAMGTDFIFSKSSAPLFNCAFVTTEGIKDDFSAPFAWAMDMSMLGVGVGFDVLGASAAVSLRSPRISREIHVVEDSREGWVDCFRRILDAHTGHDSLPASWDFSQIRAAGVPLKTFGGIAPGAEPLKRLVDRVTALLCQYVKEDRPVDSTLIVDLMNFSGEAVVSGGVRRTAQLALGPLEDDYLNLKTPENINNPALSRWASNNSIAAQVGMDYSVARTHSATNGEPGFVWLDNCRGFGRLIDGKGEFDPEVMGVNPCGEITLNTAELCNICDVVPSRHTSLDDFLHTLKFAYLYTKTVTLLPTHVPRTNAVQFKNRRIGVSLTGIVENVTKIGLRQHLRWCDLGYQSLRNWDQVYSNWLCVPRSIKLTTVKPAGTTSLLPGVTPGVHFPHSEYYIRRVRINKNSDMWQILQSAGFAVEPDAYESNNTMVVSFPVHEPNFSLRKDQVSIWEQLRLATAMQRWWSDNAVSVTVTVPEGQEAELPRALAMYEEDLKSVSFLPLSAEGAYVQAPYEAISKDKYQELASVLKKYKLEPDESDRVEEKFCTTDRCTI